MRSLVLAALAGLLLTPLAAAGPDLPPDVPPVGNCAWNHAFTDPIEAVAPVDFREGDVCYVWIFPCDDYSTRMCLPRLIE